MWEIRPQCRSRLSQADLSFLQAVLTGRAGDPDGALLALLADEEVRDRLLDEPALFHTLLEEPGQLAVSERLYFYVLVRHALLRAGLEDREAADYIAGVLVQWTHQLTQKAGLAAREPFSYVHDVLAQIEQAEGYRRFALITFLGNQSLVLTGVFPEHLEERARRRAAPPLEFYESVGRSQYARARHEVLAREFALEGVYTTLSEDFPAVRQSLNHLKDHFLHLGDGSSDLSPFGLS